MKETGLTGCVYDVSFDHRAFDMNDITNIHKI